MASLVTSDNKWACINGGDELERVEVSKINGSFLMSLMEELQDHVEERDEERLNSVIRSLEKEINLCTMDAEQDSCMEPDHHQFTSDVEDSHSCDNLEQIDGHDFSISIDDLDMNEWINMEAAAPCSPSHEMNCYVYHCGDEMSTNGVIGFEGISTDYSAYNFYGVVL